MKALSGTQPFPTLIRLGAKRIETRDWGTKYRGPLAIHASKAFPDEYRRLCLDHPFYDALAKGGHITSGLSLGQIALPGSGIHLTMSVGCVVAVCELTGCFATPPEGVPWREYFGGFRLPPDEPERSFGDYSPGRFAWRLEHIRPLATPLPARGALGLWDWSPPDDLQLLEAV